MKRIKEKITRILCTVIAATTMSVVLPFSGTAYAEGSTGVSEDNLQSILSQYEEKNIEIKEGLLFNIGESGECIELFQLDDLGGQFNIYSYDSSIISVDGTKITAVGPGYTYIAIETNTGVILCEVGVNNTIEYSSRQVLSSVDNNGIMTAANTGIMANNNYYTVFIDAGHGGSDPGAGGNGIVEKELNLDIAQKVQLLLQSKGIHVIMSRNNDTFVSLSDRRTLIQNSDADASVSIHANTASSNAAYGIETYYELKNGYSNSESKKIATEVQNSLGKTIYPYENVQGNRGIRNGNGLALVRDFKIPAILTEVGFMTNASEAVKLKTSSYRQLLASLISNGISSYLEKNVTLPTISAARIYGSTRYETSYAIANKGWTSSDTVVIASGANYPDALCAAPLAEKYNAPILLSSQDTLNNQAALKQQISKLGAKKAYIIGGTSVLSSSLESELSAMGITATRLGGSTRYETSVLVARELGTVTEAVVASGQSFADSLSISSIAAKKGIPVLLTEKNNLTGVISEYLTNMNVNKTYVIGGVNVVADAAVNAAPGAVRLAGDTRYTTNEAIFNTFKSEINLNNLYIAVGTNFPDALSVSALAGKESAFVLLAHPTYAQDATKNILVNNSLGNVYVLGGPNALSDSVLAGHYISAK